MEKTKKIKVFLGGWVNCNNAQNHNCHALAKYLDKDKFEVTTLTLYGGNVDCNDLLDVKLLHARWPARVWQYIVFLRGIAWCDVGYFPRGDVWQFCAKCVKLFGKKSFKTVEGVINRGTDKAAIRNVYHSTTKTVSITKFMVTENERWVGVIAPEVLYLGCEVDTFSGEVRKHDKLRNVIFIGHDMRRKGVTDILFLAQRFPNLTFHLVGDGNGCNVNDMIAEHGVTNCKVHGTMSHQQLAKLISEMDLHIFPSRSEGFPKVTLETAAMGVPSIVYGDYGAAEWITTGMDGFVVSTLEDIEAIVRDLEQHPIKLDSLAGEAIKLGKSFDWKVLVKDWEKFIEDLYYAK